MNLISITPSSDSLGLSLAWDDGSALTVPFWKLRKECPCSPCRSQRDRENKPGALPAYNPMPEEAVTLTGISHVGNYAIGLRWADGHNTGIYPFDYLKRLGEMG